jgi:hypothetical protein
MKHVSSQDCPPIGLQGAIDVRRARAHVGVLQADVGAIKFCIACHCLENKFAGAWYGAVNLNITTLRALKHVSVSTCYIVQQCQQTSDNDAMDLIWAHILCHAIKIC